MPLDLPGPHPTATSRSRRSANWRERRTKNTATKMTAPGARTIGQIQIRANPPVAGGTNKMVWPYCATSVCSIWPAERPCATMRRIS